MEAETNICLEDIQITQKGEISHSFYMNFKHLKNITYSRRENNGKPYFEKVSIRFDYNQVEGFIGHIILEEGSLRIVEYSESRSLKGEFRRLSPEEQKTILAKLDEHSPDARSLLEKVLGDEMQTETKFVSLSTREYLKNRYWFSQNLDKLTEYENQWMAIVNQQLYCTGKSRESIEKQLSEGEIPIKDAFIECMDFLNSVW